MKQLSALAMVAIFWASTALADGIRYQMRVDGLVCPFCAYGVEKNLKKIAGVKEIEVDLNNGVVTVSVATGVTLTESQMTKLFNDAGFTFRSMSAAAQ